MRKNNEEYLYHDDEQLHKKNLEYIRHFIMATYSITKSLIRLYYNILTYKEQLAAVKQNGCVIQYIDDITEEMQLAAVRQDLFAFKYIISPTPAVKEYIARMYGKEPE